MIGPAAIPMLELDEVDRAPVLAILSTLAHMQHPECAQQALWTLRSLGAWPSDDGARLADIMMAALTSSVHKRMEKLMETGKFEYQSDFARKYFAQGRAVGKSELLLQLLRWRDIPVPEHAAERIAAERDPDRIEAWAYRALTATSIDDVLADD